MIPSPNNPAETAAPTGAATSVREKCVLFAPLPDPVGFAGNFAAVLGGRLVTGGGSQFPDKPLWLGGQKAYSDRLFALAEPHGNWIELAIRLPQPMAHFATATSDGAVYLAGGIGCDGVSRTVLEIRAKGEELSLQRLTDLPKPLVYAAGVVANGRLYVAGGQHDANVKVATSEVWSLDLRTAAQKGAWSREPDVPGTGTFVAAMAARAGTVYFVGGVGYDADGKGVQSKKIFQLAPGARQWEPLPDLPEPRVGAVAPCPVIAGQRLLVMGGYTSAFTGERRDHPGFSRQTFLYDLAARSWSLGPVLPHVRPANKDATTDAGPAPMVAAAGAVWRGHFVAVGGEVRASVRTRAVVAIPLSEL